MFSPGSLKFEVAFRGRVGRVSWAQGAARAKLLGRKRLCVHWVALGQVVCREGLESQDGDQGERRWEDRAGGGLRLLWML